MGNNIQQDKLQDIKESVRELLVSENIIDKNGNILDINRYSARIQELINSRKAELDALTENGSILEQNRYKASIYFGDIEYLEQIKTCRKSINTTYPETVNTTHSKTVIPGNKSPLQRFRDLVNVIHTVVGRVGCRK